MKKLFLSFTLFLMLLHLAGCGAPSAPSQPESSAPIVVAVIDTGFSPDAIPLKNTLAGKNYLDPQLDCRDTYGHGTAVASIILERAPETLLVPLVSNAYDDGTIRQVDNEVLAQMIEDAVDVYHCDIINLSAGLALDKKSVRKAVAYAISQNVPVICSAGNDYHYNGAVKYYPAGYEDTIAVGALTADGTSIAEFSQRGDWVDLYATGEAVTITTLSGSTRTSDGTSFSAAKVTAQTALLLAQNPDLTVAQLTEQLLAQAQSIDGDILCLVE